MDLALVMPVYNEGLCIRNVVESWYNVLESLRIKFVMIVLNDGSRDGTEEQLARFAGYTGIEVVNKPNSGHGPTILMGYRKAVLQADWVFQCDSDDEMKAEHFPKLWEKREDYDALFGVRERVQQSVQRKFVSLGSRITVRLLFGKGVMDVNSPYRLIRSNVLARIVDQIPDHTFAPNVVISGALARGKFRIYNHPVPHEPRKTGAVSIANWKLYRAAVKSFGQTWRCSRSIIVEPLDTL